MRENNDGLVALGDGLWVTQFHRRHLGLHLRSRMGVARLASGGLLLYSPIPIDDARADELARFGKVEHIVAPNKFHHLFAGLARERYPDAKLWAAPGLPEKRKDLGFDGVLEEGTNPFGDTLDKVFLAGTPTVNETVLFHRASRTLLCCDFVMNIHDEDALAMALFYRLYGTWKQTAQSRGWKSWTRDREQARDAVGRVLSWDVRRVAMAHGDVLTEDVRSRLERATAWLRA